ncbi:MAG: insulinase family protein [Deltaproteobacteria bacterium]|nr:insulinase family protein [Deltaproteobacteria bacterium]
MRSGLRLLALLFLAAALPALAATPPWPHEQSDLSPDPAIRFETLENGMRVVLMHNEKPRDRVAVYLDVQAGSLWEEDGEQGMAHFLEHMMFNGTEHFGPEEMIEYFQSLGMRFGPDINAYTGFDETVYLLLLPDGKPKSLEDAFTVMWDYAAGALLKPEQIEKEKGVILAEMQARDSVSYRTFVEVFKFLLPDARVSRRMPIGEKEVIEGADRELLKGFYDAWYRPENMVLVVVGDFDPDDALPLARKRFASMGPRADKKPGPPPQTVRHEGLKTFYHYESEAGKTRVSIETARTIEEAPYTFEKAKNLLLSDMANTAVSHRLEQITSDPESPLSSAEFGSGEFLGTIAFSNINGHCEPDKWKQALEVLEKELRKALEYGFTEAEADRVKKETLSRLQKAAAQQSSRESNALARAIVGALNKNEVFQSPRQELEIFSPVVEAATPQALHQALVANWPDTHRLVYVTGNAEIARQEEKAKKEIARVYEQSRKTAVKPPKAEEAAKFPYLPEPETMEKPVFTKAHPDIGVREARWENGAVLFYKKTDFSENQILFSLNFGRGGASEPKDAPGLSAIAPLVAAESGLGALTREQLRAALAGTSTSLALRVGQDSFSYAGSTIPEELNLAVQLLYHHLKDPAFRQDAFAVAMRRFVQRYDAMAHTVEGVMAMEGARFLAGGDSRFGLPDKTVFSRYTVEQVRDWLLPAITRAPVTLSVVGDIDEDKLLSLCGKYLAALDREKKPPPLSRNRKLNFPKAGTLDLAVDTEIEKGLITTAWPTDDVWDIHQTRRLNVLADVFSDRMRVVLREKLGLTYSPAAFNMPSRAYPGYGVFHARVTADPKVLSRVHQEILSIAGKLAQGTITDDELSRALEPTLVSIREQKRKNSYWLNTVLSGAADHPEQLDWARTILEDYSSITVDEVTRMAKKFLKPKAAAKVTVKPKDGKKGKDGKDGGGE